MLNFRGPKKKNKKVINSFTKCLISVKIAILTPHIIPPPLGNVWLIFDLQKLTMCDFGSQSMLSKSTLFCMDLQPAADPYNVVCSANHRECTCVIAMEYWHDWDSSSNSFLKDRISNLIHKKVLCLFDVTDPLRFCQSHDI